MMNQQNITDQPLLNGNALGRSLMMWLLLWGAIVLLVTYAGQPGVVCMTPMAWLLALPAGWNYVVFAQGQPGRQPFVAGAILGAILGLLYGMLFFGVSAYSMPAGPDPSEAAKAQNVALFMIGAGAVIAALLSGFMAYRAAALQRRGQTLPVIKVKRL
jgi:hypothetical protein